MHAGDGWRWHPAALAGSHLIRQAHWRILALVGAGLILIACAAAPLAWARDPMGAPDVGPNSQFLTAAEVLDDLRVANLSVRDVTHEPVAASPSGPPATEKEALRFTILDRGDHPLTGRVLVFADARRLGQKAEWFRRAGVPVIQHRNVLIWLDTDLDVATLAAFRQAVAKMP